MAKKDQTDCIVQRGYTDEGKSTTAGIMEAAAVAVAAINTAAAINMALKQWEIANDYLEIAKWYRNYYNRVYRPYEDKLLNEVRNAQPYIPHYDTAVGRARNTARVLFKNKLDTSIQCTSAYCTGVRNALLKDQINAEAMTKAAMSGVGWRNEFQLMRAIEDLIWKRKEQVLNIGRSRMVNNIAFAELASNIYADLGQQASKAAGGAMYYLGYAGERRGTQYPMTAGIGDGTGFAERTLPAYGASSPGVHNGAFTDPFVTRAHPFAVRSMS